MKTNLLLAVICIAILIAVAFLLILNPGWKAQETLYDNHYALQLNGPSNGTVGSWNLTKGDLLNITTTVKTGQAELLIDQQTVNPSLAVDWERIFFNGTGPWQETLTVPETNKYFFNFLIYGNATSASIDGKCTRTYVQNIR